MRSPLVAVATLVAFLLCALPPRAWADDGGDLAAAKQHFEAGRAAYLGGDYGRAITEFQAAQAIRPSPILDYNIGLSYEAVGDGNNAFAAFERYLTAKPDAANRADVEQRMYAIQQRLAQQQPPAAGPAPGATGQQPGASGADPYGQGYYQQQPPSTPPQEPAPPQKKKSSNWWIIFPILGGVALTAAIITVAVVASNNSCTPPNCGGSYAHALSNLPSDPRTTINAAVPAAGLRF